MRSLNLKLTSFAILIASTVSSPLMHTANAMPNFARKYGLACSACHTTIPRLNEFGFNFRAAGFRLPELIGKSDSSFDLSHYIAVDIAPQATYATSTPPGAPSTSSFAMGLGEVGLHPLTGSLTKDLSSDVQMTFAPGSDLQIENAYVRYNCGSDEGFFSTRIGIMHPFEGYGASDEPMGLSRPLFQQNAANQAGQPSSTLFTPWGFNQFGVEAGYTVNRTAVRASVLSGIYYNSSDGSASPASGGGLVKPTGEPSSNSVDLQLFVTQILTDEGGGVSGYFYLGQADLPTGIAAADSSLFQNKFMRYAIYASYPILSARLLAGFEQGTDNTWNTVTWSKGDNFKSQGWFAEADYLPFDLFGFGVRYDQFDPSSSTADDQLSAVAAFVNYAFGNGLQIIGEYQTLTTMMGPGQEQHNNTIGLNLIWIH